MDVARCVQARLVLNNHSALFRSQAGWPSSGYLLFQQWQCEYDTLKFVMLLALGVAKRSISNFKKFFENFLEIFSWVVDVLKIHNGNADENWQLYSALKVLELVDFLQKSFIRSQFWQQFDSNISKWRRRTKRPFPERKRPEVKIGDKVVMREECE